MALSVPKIKAAGASTGGEQSYRPVIGEFLGFTDDNNTAVIKIIAPGGSKMDGKLAHVSYDPLSEEDEKKRTPIAVRVPGKTVKVQDPVTKKMVDAPLKTDWTPGMAVKFERAYFSEKGDGSEETPYQMKAHWGHTFSPEASRILCADLSYVTRFAGKEGEKPKYRVVMPYSGQSQILEPTGLADAANSIADQVREAHNDRRSVNLGMTAMAIAGDNVLGVVRVNSFMVMVDNKMTVPSGAETLAKAATAQKVDFSKADRVLVVPQLTMSVTGPQYLTERDVKDWDYLAERSVKEGSVVCRAAVIAVSPEGNYVGSMVTSGGPKDYMEVAMIHTGLIEPEQNANAEQESATSHEMPEADDEMQGGNAGPSVDNY